MANIQKGRSWKSWIFGHLRPSFGWAYRSPQSQHTSKLKGLLELRKKREVLYGATALSALLRHKVARLGKRGVVGFLVCTGVFGGLAWGSLYLFDPVKRNSLCQKARGKAHSEARRMVVSEVIDGVVSAKDAIYTWIKKSLWRSPESERTSKPKVYGATAVSALLGLTVARMRRRGVAGSLAYTGMFGGLVGGGLCLSDPEKRDRLWSTLKERQKTCRRRILSKGRDRALTKIRDKAVSAGNATMTAFKAAYQWIYTRMPEAVPGKDATVSAGSAVYHWIFGTGKK